MALLGRAARILPREFGIARHVGSCKTPLHRASSAATSVSLAGLVPVAAPTGQLQRKS